MRFRSAFLGAALGALTGVGCDGPKPVAPTAPSPPAASASVQRTETQSLHLDHAQPKLATVKLWVGPKEIDSELCRTLQQLATGLMFRPGIGEEESMFFVFPQPQPVAFYMKNVGFDIDAAYIDAEGIITEIVRLKKMDPTPVPSKSQAIQYVLETAPGWFERNGIRAGALVRTSKQSLREAFNFR